MRIPNWCLTGAFVLAMGVSCSGQTVNPIDNTATRVGAGARLDQPSNGVFGGKVPDLELAGMPGEKLDTPSLEGALDAIRAAYPNFNSVIVRDPSMPADYPVLPAMKLKNVTVGQFLQFVQASFGGVQCMRIDGPSGSLYTIRIRKDDSVSNQFKAAMDQNMVRLYRLTEIVNALADENATKEKTAAADNKDAEAKEVSRADRLKEATTQVLSLFQAALDQTDADGPCVLKVHESTQTLLFKGSYAKQRVLEEAMTSVTPRTGGRRPSSGGFGGVGPRASGPWDYSGSPNPGSNTNPFDAYNEAQRLADQGRFEDADRARMKAAVPALKARTEQMAPKTSPAPAPQQLKD